MQQSIEVHFYCKCDGLYIILQRLYILNLLESINVIIVNWIT